MHCDPKVIQGGMGAGVSNWRLARAVSQLGQLGVVSGTALDVILARRLQDGDEGGHMRAGLDAFPFRAMAERILKRYYIAGGKAAGAAYANLRMHHKDGRREIDELCIAGNFVEVWLAKQGHSHPVGINYLEKIQLPHLPSLYGAMLADVDYVLMGAGIPLNIPGAMDRLANHEAAEYPLYVNGAEPGEVTVSKFDPRAYMEFELARLKRPKFLAIIASNTLATTMVKKANGRVDGFVIEGPTAGGHNAPPRGKPPLSELGEPVYGVRDEVDLTKMCAMGLPFWLAGGFGTAEKLKEALALGAAGIQVGTAFAFCRESGLREDYKQRLLADSRAGVAKVFTDPHSSPTGFPFKAAQLVGSNSELKVYEERKRVCDVGHLREIYRTAEGKIDYRCPAEPVATYVAKGGRAEDTAGKKCLCNCLLANIGMEQMRANDYREEGLVTAGDDLVNVARFLPEGAESYGAEDVIRALLEGVAMDETAAEMTDMVAEPELEVAAVAAV